MTSCFKRLSFLGASSLVCCLLFASMFGCGTERIKQGKMQVKIKKVFRGEELDAPYFFSSILKICMNKDYVYVADWKRLSISILDKNLNFIKRIGKKGAGPGEFKILVSDIFCDDDYLYVKTIRDLHIFSPAGDFIKQLTLTFMPSASFILKDGFLFKVDNSPELFIRTDMNFQIIEKFYKNDFISTQELGKVFVGSSACLASDGDLIIMKSTEYHLEKLHLDTKERVWEFVRDVDFWEASVKGTGRGQSYVITGGSSEILEENDTYKYFYYNSKKERRLDVFSKSNLRLIGTYELDDKIFPICYRPEHHDYLGSIAGDTEALYLFDLVEVPSE